MEWWRCMATGPWQPTYALKVGLAQMLRGGVIMDVVDVEQARISKEARAAAVMALERVPADIQAEDIFVGSGIFKSGDLVRHARSFVQAVTHYNNPHVLTEISQNLMEAMVGINLNNKKVERFAERLD